MASSFFRQGIIRRSWEALWANKILWFFGLFAAILGIGEEYDLLVRNSDILDSIPSQLENLRQVWADGTLSSIGHNVVSTIHLYLPDALYLVVTWLLIILAILCFVMISQAALIEGISRHEEGKPYGLIDGFDRGMANFWSMVKLNLIAKIVVYGTLYVVVFPLVVAYIRHPSQQLILVTMFWSFVVLAPLITIVSFVTKFAQSFLVIKKYPVKQAIAAGWTMFTQNWLVTIELALLMILINLGVTLTTTYTLFGIFDFPNTSTFGYVIMFIVFGFVFSWLTVFQYGAWTNLFFRLEEGRSSSKLKRIVDYVLGIDSTTRSNRPAATNRR